MDAEKSEKTVKKQQETPSDVYKKRFWCSIVVSAIIILLMLICGTFCLIKNKDIKSEISNEDLAALDIFDEIAKGFLDNFDLDTERTIGTQVQGYGISKDGDFYISFKYFIRNEDDMTYSEGGNAKMYFWTDKETGHRSYAVSWDE